MAVVTITLSIDTSNYDDSSQPICNYVQLMNKISEKIRVTNYSLDKYSTDTFEVMVDNDRGHVTIIS